MVVITTRIFFSRKIWPLLKQIKYNERKVTVLSKLDHVEGGGGGL